MRYLSLISMFRAENPWLREWIEYHLLAGVDHFYLYANEDMGISEDILKPYVASGIVDVFHSPGPRGTQTGVFRQAHKFARGKTLWAALIDLDEFILPIQTHDIKVELQNFEEFGGVGVNWQCFGSSWLKSRPPNQLNHFLRKAPAYWDRNVHIKTICQPSRVLPDLQCNPHFVFYEPGYCCVNTAGNPITYAYSDPIQIDKLRLNHYIVRSREDFEAKMARGRAEATKPIDEEYWERHNRNEIFDDEISRRFGRKLVI